MDHFSDALKAASDTPADALDLPALHRRARSRHLRRRVTAVTAAFGLVALTGIGVAAATRGGRSPASLTTASAGAPDAIPTASTVPNWPCDPTTTTDATTSTIDPPTTIAPPDSTIDPPTTIVSPDSTIDPPTTVDVTIAATSTTEVAGLADGSDAMTVPPAAPNDEQLPAAIDDEQPLATTTTGSPDAGGPEPSTESIEPIESTTTTTVCEPGVSTTTTAPPSGADETSTTSSGSATPTIPTAPVTTAPTTTAPTTRAPVLADQMTVSGTYSGEGPILDRYPQGCPQMHHRLDASVTLDDGSSWQLRESYCGVNDGRTWRGGGTFEFADTGNDAFRGTFTSSADVPTTGEPYQMTVTDGTGRFAGATGTCDVDNHVEDTTPGRNRQYGSFTCDLEVPASPGN